MMDKNKTRWQDDMRVGQVIILMLICCSLVVIPLIMLNAMAALYILGGLFCIDSALFIWFFGR